MSHTSLGRRGEEAVRRYLEGKGYRLADRNFRRRGGELDLIMWDGDVLAVIEVKTRLNLTFGYPVEAVTKEKQRRIRLCTEVYLMERELDVPVRFDVVEVLARGDRARVHHIRNAF